MNFPDVNVLLYAHRHDMAHHDKCRVWLKNEIEQGPYGMSPLVVSGFLRVTTHPKIFSPPTPLPKALEFIRQVTSRGNCQQILPGSRHLAIFLSLCETIWATGNRVPDLYLAAIAIEGEHRLITVDKGFAQVPGLDWGHPWT